MYKYLVVVVLFVSGFSAQQPSEDDLTVLIDYEKYREHESHRLNRQLFLSNGSYAPPFAPAFAPGFAPGFLRYPSSYPYQRYGNGCGDRGCEYKVCSDPENEVYQQCGNKCVLGCRYASTSSSFTILRPDCENECVEGCFCKTGLVRHQTKCILATECPVRRCNHRFEVYMCGPAAPITCDNALRGNQILELTKRIECVWGCFCAQGYLRNNYNGRCVPEGECRNTKPIDVSPQIPGIFKIVDCSTGGCHNNGNDCGSRGCGHGGSYNPHYHQDDSPSNSVASASPSVAIPTGAIPNIGSNIGVHHVSGAVHSVDPLTSIGVDNATVPVGSDSVPAVINTETPSDEQALVPSDEHAPELSDFGVTVENDAVEDDETHDSENTPSQTSAQSPPYNNYGGVYQQQNGISYQQPGTTYTYNGYPPQYSAVYGQYVSPQQYNQQFQGKDQPPTVTLPPKDPHNVQATTDKVPVNTQSSLFNQFNPNQIYSNIANGVNAGVNGLTSQIASPNFQLPFNNFFSNPFGGFNNQAAQNTANRKPQDRNNVDSFTSFNKKVRPFNDITYEPEESHQEIPEDSVEIEKLKDKNSKDLDNKN